MLNKQNNKRNIINNPSNAVLPPPHTNLLQPMAHLPLPPKALPHPHNLRIPHNIPNAISANNQQTPASPTNLLNLHMRPPSNPNRTANQIANRATHGQTGQILVRKPNSQRPAFFAFFVFHFFYSAVFF